jgi:hypothetical protein
LHYGYENKNKKVVPMHDTPTLNIFLKFVKDFKPDTVILGGDILDCGMISHHNDRKPGKVEGLRLFRDAQELRGKLLGPLEDLVPKADLVYLIGNHEDWLDQLLDLFPGLENYFDLRTVLGLGPRWKVIPQGGKYRLGKLIFKHGDTLTGAEGVAKQAVTNAERSIRFGHNHSWSVFTKCSDVDLLQKHTGLSMPCACRKGPGYGKGRANKWVNGFGWGYVQPNGYFTDYVSIVIKGQTIVNGKLYKG